MTRAKRILATCALAAGVLGGIASPALAHTPEAATQGVDHNHGTSVPDTDIRHTSGAPGADNNHSS